MGVKITLQGELNSTFQVLVNPHNQCCTTPLECCNDTHRKLNNNFGMLINSYQCYTTPPLVLYYTTRVLYRMRKNLS